MNRESIVRANHAQPASAVPPFFCACLTQFVAVVAITSQPGMFHPMDVLGVLEWFVLAGLVTVFHVPGLALGLAVLPRLRQADRLRFVGWASAVGALCPVGVAFLTMTLEEQVNLLVAIIFTNAVNMVTCFAVLRFAISRGWLHRIARPGYCAQCGYDLRASGATCPECGARTDTGDASVANRPAS